MFKDQFAEQTRSLEDEFFFQVDQELTKKLRERLDCERTREALAAVSGISDETVLEELRTAGIRAETLAAVSLAPLVQVAWADGKLGERERIAILAAAEGQGMERDQPSFQLLEQWLEQAPNAELFVAWSDYFSALANVLSPESMETLRQDLWKSACAIAEAEGGILSIGKISAQEKGVLNRVKEAIFSDEDSTS